MSETKIFYVLHGDDDIGREEALARLIAQMGSGAEAEMNTSVFDGTVTPVPEILNAARSFPFLADKRLVIVKDLLAHLGRKGGGETAKQHTAQLLEALPNLPAYTRFVIVERDTLRADHKVLKLAESHASGYARAFTKPQDATGWIIARAKNTYKAGITPQAAHALASVTSNDLRRADNELFKLAVYVNNERDITEQDVALLTPYVAEANVFHMVDALANGNGKQALTLIHTALAQDPRDEGFGLFALIVRQFRLLLLAREHLAQGGSPRQLPDLLKVKSFVADKVAQQSRAFTVDQLDSIYRRLQSYDQDMKTGKIAPRLALDLFVTSVTRR